MSKFPCFPDALVAALLICTFIYIFFFFTSFSLKLLSPNMQKSTFSLSPLFSYALVDQFCITKYAEIVPTVNKVNAEQYKMKLTW